ncbi:hypothetical protein RvY_15610-2 [Ramazzottius varieornatus]|nr:hypothetical protein RvY_15610-2 [Ramazzottius varieornatus]
MFAIQFPTIIIWWMMLVSIGLAAFAYYQGCDPLMTGRIERTDQVVQLFVLDTLGYLKGLPGLFTAVVYSGTLSSVSSGVNSIVVVLTEDFIRPLRDLKIQTLEDEQKVMRLTKGLSFIVGFTAIGLAFVASALGRGLIQFCWSIDGMCGGPLLGLFFSGMILTYVNSKGIAVGVVAGLATTFWIGIGAIFYAAPQTPLPLSANLCMNGSNFLQENFATSVLWMNETFRNATITFDQDIESLGYEYSYDKQEIVPISILVGINRIYGVSYQYYGLIGFLVTITVASIVSIATGRQDTSKIPDRFFLFRSFSKNSKAETKIRSISKNSEYHSVSTVEAP